MSSIFLQRLGGSVLLLSPSLVFSFCTTVSDVDGAGGGECSLFRGGDDFGPVAKIPGILPVSRTKLRFLYSGLLGFFFGCSVVDVTWVHGACRPRSVMTGPLFCGGKCLLQHVLPFFFLFFFG